MNTETWQWSIADSLPQTLTNATATVCGDTICLVGGRSFTGDPANSVITGSLNAFLHLPQPQIISAKRKNLLQAEKHPVWSKIAALPVEGSTCVTLTGQLLDVGGYEPLTKSSHSTQKENPGRLLATFLPPPIPVSIDCPS